MTVLFLWWRMEEGEKQRRHSGEIMVEESWFLCGANTEQSHSGSDMIRLVRIGNRTMKVRGLVEAEEEEEEEEEQNED